MAYRSIFGDDLTEYQIEVIVQSGLPQAQWEAISNQINQYQSAHSTQASRYKLIKLLKAAGAAGSTAVALGKAYYNSKLASQDPSRSTKKLRSGDSSLTSQSARVKQDLKHKVPAKQPHGPDPKPVTAVIDNAGNIEPKAPQDKKSTLWFDYTLQNKDSKWLHANDNPQTVPVTLPKAKMAEPESTGPSATAPNQVTPVSNFSNAFEGVPRQYTTILPYERTFTSNTLSGTAGQLNSMVLIRMNSIFDVMKSIDTYAADPPPADDTMDATAGEFLESPYWRDHWLQFYEYWTVIECRYKIHIYNTMATNKRSLSVFHGYSGIQQPPLLAAGTTGADITFDTFRRWKGFQHKTLGPIVASGTSVHTDDHRTTISGVYHPGDGTHEIIEDELVETWIRGANVPKEQNTLCLIFTRGPLNDSTTSSVTFDYRVELEYVVQFKDQKSAYAFPTSSTTNFSKIDSIVP